MRALRVAYLLCCSQLHLLEHLHQRTLLRCVCPRKFVCVCSSACLPRTVDVTAGLMINGDIASCIESEVVSEAGNRDRGTAGSGGAQLLLRLAARKVVISCVAYSSRAGRSTVFGC